MFVIKNICTHQVRKNNMVLNWLELQVYMPIDASLFEDAELSEVEKLTAGVVEGYEIGTAYINLSNKTVESIFPKCFIPKGKQNKKFYSEIVFSDGSFALCVEKSTEVYHIIDKYAASLPISEEN